jgi:chromosome partitioning protein
MQVVATLSRKGGSAKSTVCRTFAVQALIEGIRSGIIDADDQATCINWAKRRAAQVPTVMTPGNKGIGAAIDELRRKKADITFIDTPPTIHPVVSIALDAANACIIVTEPLPESIETVGAMARIVERLGKPAAIIITRVPIRSSALRPDRTR